MMVLETNVIEYAAWDAWKPEEYLAEYYAEVMPDERHALEFLVEWARKLTPVRVALDFGCGPTVHHLFPLVDVVREFHLAEYLPANRAAVLHWLSGADDAHDWRAFARETLMLEGRRDPPLAIVEAREWETRARTTRVLHADAGDEDPLGPAGRRAYPLVTTHYCAEGATDNKETWRRYMRNIASLVAPEGTLILSACGAASFYCVGDHLFPCAGVDGMDILHCLAENGFGDIDLRIRQVPDHSEQGYGTVLFARAVRMA